MDRQVPLTSTLHSNVTTNVNLDISITLVRLRNATRSACAYNVCRYTFDHYSLQELFIIHFVNEINFFFLFIFVFNFFCL